MQTLSGTAQEKYRTSAGLFEVLVKFSNHSVISPYCHCKFASLLGNRMKMWSKGWANSDPNPMNVVTKEERGRHYWAKRVEVQKVLLEVTKRPKNPKNLTLQRKPSSKIIASTPTHKYCGTFYESRICPIYEKNSAGYGRANHLEWVCRSVCRRATRDAVRKRYRDVHGMCQDAAEIEVWTEKFDMQ